MKMRCLALTLLLSSALPMTASAFSSYISTTFQGSALGPEQALGVMVGQDGNVYVAGTTFRAGSNQDIWLAKYSPSLVLISSIAVTSPGSASDQASGLVQDAQGNIFVAGMFTRAGSGLDAWVGKFTSSLVLVSSYTFDGGANGTDYLTDIALGPDGNLYVTGGLTGGTQLDVYLAKFNTSPTPITAISVDGLDSMTDVANDIAIDAQGRIFVAGALDQDRSGDGITGTVGWLAEFNSSLSKVNEAVYAVPGSPLAIAHGLAVSGAGDVYVVGHFDPPGTFGSTSPRAWVAAFDSSLDLRREHRELGPATSHAYAAAVDAKGNLFVTGERTTGATADIWLSEFDSSLEVVSNATFSPGTSDNGFALALDGVSGVYVAGGATVSSDLGAWLSRHNVPFHPRETVDAFRSYPSPFRPGAGDLTFDALPADAFVRVYNAAGGLVVTLTADTTGRASWDGRNGSGEPVATGVYLVLASGPGGTQTGRVAVQR